MRMLGLGSRVHLRGIEQNKLGDELAYSFNW